MEPKQTADRQAVIEKYALEMDLLCTIDSGADTQEQIIYDGESAEFLTRFADEIGGVDEERLWIELVKQYRIEMGVQEKRDDFDESDLFVRRENLTAALAAALGAKEKA